MTVGRAGPVSARASSAVLEPALDNDDDRGNGEFVAQVLLKGSAERNFRPPLIGVRRVHEDKVGVVSLEARAIGVVLVHDAVQVVRRGALLLVHANAVRFRVEALPAGNVAITRGPRSALGGLWGRARTSSCSRP